MKSNSPSNSVMFMVTSGIQRDKMTYSPRYVFESETVSICEQILKLQAKRKDSPYFKWKMTTLTKMTVTSDA